MPEVTIKPSMLKKNHPALTKSGRFKAKARRVLGSRTMRTRVRPNQIKRANWGNDFTLRKPADWPIRNTALFHRIADEIELFPEEYNQNIWGAPTEEATPCGTAFCIAGHAAHQTGWLPGAKNYDGEIVEWDMVVRPKDHTRRFGVSTVARNELGLTDNESEFLFRGDWKPVGTMTVPEALRQIGNGARIDDVSRPAALYHGRQELIEEYNERPSIRTTGKLPVY